MDDPVQAAYAQALKLLARREHSHGELRLKLRQRGMDTADIAAALEQLVQHGYLSDLRYAQARVTELLRRRYGPLRAQAELRARGIDDDTIGSVLDLEQSDWYTACCEVRENRFGRAPPSNAVERSRQQRHLQARGFTGGQIRQALGNTHSDDA
ncbi:MAG: regulatory protein RecX [Immundisolibacter sp.]|uniref:regulatory protein RecX n=1 Tax=Immundisolibacter sp. TaxID=1934948 RepID=UPI003EDF3629